MGCCCALAWCSAALNSIVHVGVGRIPLPEVESLTPMKGVVNIMQKRTSISVASAVLAMTAGAFGGPMMPWDYTVFGVSGVGNTSQRLTGNVTGTVGAYGHVYLGSISLSAGLSGYAVVADQQFDMSGGSMSGNVYAGQNANVNSATISGSLSTGGLLKGGGGSITGPTVAAIGNQSTLSLNGGFEQRASADIWDLASIASFFVGMSQSIAGAESTTTYANAWGQLQISAASGLNIVDISSSALDSAWGVSISGPSDATVVFRVSGVQATLNSINWNTSGGIDPANVLVNYFEAETLNISGGHGVTFLAPLASVQFSGNLTGAIIGDEIRGGGSINSRSFAGDLSSLSIPSPASALILASPAAMFLGRRPRR